MEGDASTRMRTRGFGGVSSPSSFMYSSKPWLSVRRHLPSRSLRLAMAGGRAGKHESSSRENAVAGALCGSGLHHGLNRLAVGRCRTANRRCASPGTAPSPLPGPLRQGPCLGSVGATLTAPDCEVTRLPQLLQAVTRLARPTPPPVTLRHRPARPLAQEPLPLPGQPGPHGPARHGPTALPLPVCFCQVPERN